MEIITVLATRSGMVLIVYYPQALAHWDAPELTGYVWFTQADLNEPEPFRYPGDRVFHSTFTECVKDIVTHCG